MTSKPTVSFDDIMFTSIDSEDFLDNEEKPSLTSSWSSDSEKDCQWKSSNSSLSQLQSPPKQINLPACSTPVNCESNNDPKFLVCHELSMNNNARSLSGVDINKVSEKTPNEMNCLSSSSNRRTRRSLSLHDLDNVFEFPSNKLAKNVVSCEMSHSSASSKTRSKDSGIHRTISCVSLLSNNTYNRKYDHVQSKVKQYIQSMKELGSKNRQSKNIIKPCVTNNSESRMSSDTVELTEEKFNELKNELLEKDLLISTYHEKYMDLQIKYVNLKQKFDAFRFGSTFQSGSFSPDQLYYSAEDSLKPDLSNLVPSNCTHQSCDSSDAMSPLKNKSLKPVSNFHSTTTNLNRQFVTLQSVQANKSSSQSTQTSQQSFMKLRPGNEFDLLQSSDVRGVDPFLKVKRWQESLSNSKTEEIDSNKNNVQKGTVDSAHAVAQEPKVQIFNSLPLDLPQNVTNHNQLPSNDSFGNDCKFNHFEKSVPELSSFKFVRLVGQEQRREHSEARIKPSDKPETFSQGNDTLNESSSCKAEEKNLKVKSFLISVPAKQSKCDEPDMSRNSAAACTEEMHQSDKDKIVLKKSRLRRKVRKIKQKGEVPDVLLNLTKDNPSSAEDLRDIDSTCEKIKPISMKNVFKPVFDMGDSFRSISKPDMLPFTSSTMESNLNIRKLYVPKNLINSNHKENTTDQNSSHALVPTTFYNPTSGSSLASIPKDKSNKSALCCCLETSDLYINQLNEGLDKLMIALTELGTSSVLKN